MENPVRIAALLTCHNRREMTVACLRSLRAQAAPIRNSSEIQDSEVSAFSFQHSTFSSNRFTIDVFLVDDGCTDGTADGVREVWPEATIIQGDGDLFWCGGMRVAWTEAAKSDPDYYLLLNDDTFIVCDAVAELLNLVPLPGQLGIAVAPVEDPDTGLVVFGGHKGHEPTPVHPNGSPAPCDTMNANCALVPRAVFQKIGSLHHAFSHAMGDFDYGFHATRSGIRVTQAGRILGRSTPNTAKRTWQDRSLSRIERFRLLWRSPKGLPFFEWATYCRRNMGWGWLYRAVSPALRIIAGK